MIRIHVGDRIICLKNNWECINEAGDALVNGLTTNLTYTKDNPFMEVTLLRISRQTMIMRRAWKWIIRFLWSMSLP